MQHFGKLLINAFCHATIFTAKQEKFKDD